jgi:perosamine synthetase
MHPDVAPMIVAKDQFFSLALMSARQLSKSTQTDARYSFFQARYAIYHSLKLLGIEPGDQVLVPSYICRAAIDPILASSVDVAFYAVDDQCSANLADLKRSISPRTKALMIVHYFGFPQPLREIRHLCDIHGIALIEDCAHVLCGEADGEPMGSIGDAAVFSWRKFFPVYDGGELVMNRPRQFRRIPRTKESALFTLKAAANTLDARLEQARTPLLKLAYNGLRAGEALFRRCANSHLQKTPMMQASSNDLSFDPASANWPMTRLSRWTKNHSNVGRIMALRRRNYEILLEELSTTDGVMPMFRDLPPTLCPWVFPVVFQVSAAHLALRRRGIPAVTWGGVRHPQIPRDRYAQSDFLYENLVFLPVHQCLNEDDIMNMVRRVKEVSGKQKWIS